MKIGKYINPISGKEGDLGDMGQNAKNILGVASIFGFFAIGQYILKVVGKALGNKVPLSANLVSNQTTVTEQPKQKAYNLV